MFSENNSHFVWYLFSKCLSLQAYSSLYNLIFNEMKRTNHRQQGRFERPLTSKELGFDLCCRIESLEHELSETRRQLIELVCSRGEVEESALCSQCPSFRTPRLDGSMKASGHIVYKEELERLSGIWQTPEALARLEARRRVLDEL